MADEAKPTSSWRDKFASKIPAWSKKNHASDDVLELAERGNVRLDDV